MDPPEKVSTQGTGGMEQGVMVMGFDKWTHANGALDGRVSHRISCQLLQPVPCAGSILLSTTLIIAPESECSGQRNPIG